MELACSANLHTKNLQKNFYGLEPVFTTYVYMGTKSDRLHQGIKTALKLLKRRQGDVSLSEMAEILGSSPRRASAHFHRITGMEFRFAQMLARVKPARTRVLGSAKSLATIAREFGYSRQTKFEQSYKRAFGITPAQDRARSRG